MRWHEAYWRRDDGIGRGAKLTPETVREIFLDQRNAKEIAAARGIGVTTVRNIKNRRAWREATEGLSNG